MKKQYKELTEAEKLLIVGYIYNLYIEWNNKKFESNHLKNSLFCDFCDEFKLEESYLKDYIDYSYLLEYKKEYEVKDVERGYGYIVPKTELSTLKKRKENKFFMKEDNSFFYKENFNS